MIYFGKTLISDVEIKDYTYDSPIKNYNGVLCSNIDITEIYMPNVLSIADYGLEFRYANCSNIRKFNFPDLEYIGKYGCYMICQGTEHITDFEFPKLKYIGGYGFGYIQNNAATISSFNFPELEYIGDHAFYNANFHMSIDKLEFPKLKTIDQQGFLGAFTDMNSFKELNFPELTSVGKRAMEEFTTYEAPNISSISFPKLQVLGQQAFTYAFNSTNLSTVSFPSLSVIDDTALEGAFDDNEHLTAIHFRADVQEQIEECEGYDENFGAVNATIYFDL